MIYMIKKINVIVCTMTIFLTINLIFNHVNLINPKNHG